MAKYVCDFDQVYSIGEKVSKSASDLKTSIDSYAKKIDSDLSGWSGDAKTAFESSNSKIVSTSTGDAEYVYALGEFIKEASKKIQDLENQLAGLSI